MALLKLVSLPCFQTRNYYSSPRNFSKQITSNSKTQQLVRDFNPKIPLEQAQTPPTSWYTDPTFHHLELQQLFYRGWQAVGFKEQIQNPHHYFTGRDGLMDWMEYSSRLQEYQEYKTLTSILGIALIPFQVAIWGPFVLINLDKDVQLLQEEIHSKTVANEWLGSCSEMLSTNGIDSSLAFVCRREYTINCNWKVFCDNYLDGGYHVPYAHTGLASGLKLESYSTTIFEKVSLQMCESGVTENKDECDRLGSKAIYAFVYPNFMINRYGPWMDTNLVLPLGPNKCQVIFDYFLESSLKALPCHMGWPSPCDLKINNASDELEVRSCPDDKSFIESSLAESERVQMEDITLCEGVQKGLESPAYCTGRYAPTVEKAMHHFHCLLFENLTK
ncbi:hypothetical protein IFM89_009157 [Coptis chinensis]|uniref:Choline monooxygenase, chloroplastic n=1 Tax=Coptis chinensis TaxID=261450 RepID=A0A835LZ33_9MAGN|nr:hypothetical protein IFM89_009157 [Coptis chinensis]